MIPFPRIVLAAALILPAYAQTEDPSVTLQKRPALLSIFNRKDKDKDDVLSREEFSEGKHADLTDEIFDKKDKDLNGVLSAEEFIKNPGPEIHFQAKDKDKDGFISLDEFLVKSDDPVKAENTFIKRDKDKDGKLSPEEFSKSLKN